MFFNQHLQQYVTLDVNNEAERATFIGCVRERWGLEEPTQAEIRLLVENPQLRRELLETIGIDIPEAVRDALAANDPGNRRPPV